MALNTPQSIINFALRAAGILGVGQSALAEDNTDCFDVLNAMIGDWNQKRWLIWHLVDVAKVSTGALNYSVGPGGDFPYPQAPSRLEAAFFRQIVSSQPNQIDYPLQILQAREDYNTIALKTLVSWPTYIFYDADFSVASSPPFCGFVYPWPVPQASLYELHLTLKEILPSFANYRQTINLPGEYFEALWTNLALRLPAIYPGANITPVVEGLAKASMETIRVANTQVPLLRLPPGLSRPALYNIFSDQSY